jgi:predicted short-subunit dehydrogenase-like oxidoreductase (DUF2520 family)
MKQGAESRDTRRSGPRTRQKLSSVSVIGAGNWGKALALALHGAGTAVPEIIVRHKSRSNAELAAAVCARNTTLDRAELNADVLWICTPDAAISRVAADLAARISAKAAVNARDSRIISRRIPPIVFHSSGALTSEELATLRAVKASIASVHPLMTFPRRKAQSTQARASKKLTGVPFALEGDARACRAARKLISTLGGEAFTLPAKDKALYHAFGAFTSPLLVALLTAAAEVASVTGWSALQTRRRMRPIVERTVENFFADGPGESFSGPIARGDAATVARHLAALRSHPHLAAVYRDLSRFALRSLPARNPRSCLIICFVALARSVRPASRRVSFRSLPPDFRL